MEPGIQDYWLPSAFSKHKTWTDAGNNMKDNSSDHITYFHSSDFHIFLIITSSFSPFSAFSVIRGLAIAALPWVLDL